ncbi:putative RNA helicase, partial [Kickxella alabastrina]
MAKSLNKSKSDSKDKDKGKSANKKGRVLSISTKTDRPTLAASAAESSVTEPSSSNSIEDDITINNSDNENSSNEDNDSEDENENDGDKISVIPLASGREEYPEPPMCTFSSLGLDPWLINTLGAMSITQPTEIQRACIGPILQGLDVIGGAKTGSGKTAAFALPILQKLSEDPYGVFAVVLTPTRELAYQIAEQFAVLGKGMNIKVTVTIGGIDMMAQAMELSRRPHIVVATPGRLADHIESSAGAVHFKGVQYLVLDEADRLLSDTFASDLGVIMDAIPKDRKTL